MLNILLSAGQTNTRVEPLLLVFFTDMGVEVGVESGVCDVPLLLYGSQSKLGMDLLVNLVMVHIT